MIELIKELGDISAESKAEIISSRTIRPISLAELENLLSFEGLAWRNEITGSWEGPLVEVMNLGGEIGEGLVELFRHINKTRSVQIETNKAEWAVKCRRLLDGLVTGGVITQEQSDKVVALGGGRPYQGVDDEQVINETLQEEAKAARQSRVDEFMRFSASIQNDFIFPSIDGDETVEQLKARIKQEL